jgi:hypothetical protein
MRLLFLGALLLPALMGQDFRGQIKIKPLVPPLNQPWKAQPALGGVTVLKQQVVESGPCSIPLLNVVPVEGDQQMVVTPPSTGFHMRNVTPPAPSCADKARR